MSRGYEGTAVNVPAYDFAEIRRRVLEIQSHERAWDRELEASGLVRELFWYEDLATNYEETIRRALRVLGVPDEVPVPAQRLAKQASGWNDGLIARYLADLRTRNITTGNS